MIKPNDDIQQRRMNVTHTIVMKLLGLCVCMFARVAYSIVYVTRLFLSV